MPAPINDSDVKLMLAMIASAESLKTDNEKLATIIGGGVTANAIRQRVHKIKTQAKAVLSGENLDIKVAETGKCKSAKKPDTPAKRKAPASEDEEVQETPSKKRAPDKIVNSSTKSQKGEMKKDNSEDVSVVDSNTSVDV